MTERLVLDWRHPRHQSRKALRCRYCRQLTYLRDNEGRPAHKVCAEKNE